MAVNYTYDEIVKQVLLYLNRNDPTTVKEVPNGITLGIRRIIKTCKTLGLISYYYGYLTPGVWMYEKPALWRNTSRVIIKDIKPPNSPNNPDFGKQFPVKIVNIGYVEAYNPDILVQGRPVYYAEYQYNYWYIAPTPDYAYPIKVAIYQSNLLFSESEQINFLIQNAPELVIKASLLELQFFVVDKSMIPVWQQEYQQALNDFNNEDAMRQFDDNTSRGEGVV